MTSSNYTIHEDGSITFAEGIEVTPKIRENAEKAAKTQREKATAVEDDVEVRETAEGKTEREKASE